MLKAILHLDLGPRKNLAVKCQVSEVPAKASFLPFQKNKLYLLPKRLKNLKLSAYNLIVPLLTHLQQNLIVYA